MTNSELEALRAEFEKAYSPLDLNGSFSERAWIEDQWIAYLTGHAAAQPKWLPIETAPKDTEVLVGPTKRMGICVAMNDSRDGWVTETLAEWVSIYTPTHYMPLPSPPEQKE